MKKSIRITFSLLLISLNCFSQTWHWAKRGGTVDDTDNGNDKWEQVRSIVTDSQNNVYILANVGIQNLNVDGNALPTYSLYDGGGQAMLDFVITSFSCDGGYRWSKVIGGQLSDSAVDLQIDALDNIYLAGRAYNEFDDFAFPGSKPKLHFGDLVIPYALSNTQGNESLFLLKYDSSGNLQWLRRPQSYNMHRTQMNQSATFSLQVDQSGTSYWYCSLAPGSYFNDALVTTQQGTYMIKYDTTGNFISATLVDIVGTEVGLTDVKLRRNHNNGITYASNFVSHSVDGTSVTTGGQLVNGSKFIAAFDDQGTFLWKRENNTKLAWTTQAYDMVFDADNNIYWLGAAGTVTALTSSEMESFNGIPFTAPVVITDRPVPYILKLDATGNTIWSTSGDKNIFRPVAIGINGDEVALASSHRGVNWGPISIPYNQKGYDVYMARFNRADGNIIDINTFESTTAVDDCGTALASDGDGNYLLGGRFWQQVVIGSTTLIDPGSETDFFITKFGSNACEMSVGEEKISTIKAYPNPVRDRLQLNNTEAMSYRLFSITGACLVKGTIGSNGTIEVQTLPAGMYLLQLQSENGTQSLKLLKQ